MTSDGIAERVLHALLDSELAGIEAARLFGSHAEGRAHRESDVDVAVLLARDAYPTPDVRFEARVQLASRLGPALPGLRPDVVVLNDAPPTLGRAVVQSGRLLLGQGSVAEHEYRRDVQLRAADLDPWLRRMRRMLLDSIGPR
jgi:predicted nucleotidyltransferase